MNDLYKHVKGKKVLIAELYDVLIISMLHDKLSLYQHIESLANLPGFYEARVDAEYGSIEQLNKKGKKKISIDEIYSQMHPCYSGAKEIELKLENTVQEINPDMVKLFDWAQKNNVAIYICDLLGSSPETNEKLLNQKGFSNYKKIFRLQSETEKKNMISEIIQETGAEENDILYLGKKENLADFSYLGIQTFAYESIFRLYGQNRNSAFFAVLNNLQNKDVMITLLQSMIVLNKNENDWFLFGFRYIGPIFFEYIKYIGSVARKLGINKLFFSSENGSCLKEITEILFPEIEAILITCPKKTLLLSAVSDEDSLCEILLRKVRKGCFEHVWFEKFFHDGSKNLRKEFFNKYPDKKHCINSDEDINNLRDFIVKNKTLIFEEAKKEREALQQCFNQKKLDDTAAVVDITKDMEFLFGVQGVCKSFQKKSMATAFWWEYATTLSWKSDLIDSIQIKKILTKNIDTFNYLNNILGLALCNSNSIIQSQSKNMMIREEKRLKIRSCIVSGAMDIVKKLNDYDHVLRTKESHNISSAIYEYLEKHISRKDRALLEQAYRVDEFYDEEFGRPLFKQNEPMIGIANPWPEDVSAEAEVITRMQRAAEENGIGCTLIDGFGHLLNRNQGLTKDFVKEDNLSFVITTHYECAKILNTFYYNPLWNPPEIPLNLSDYTPRVTNLFMMNDDYLIYNEGGMTNHLRSVLLNCPRTLEGCSALTASFPASAALEPNLSKPTMFYCGMNWEVMFGGPGRHDGLFKLLDDSGKVKIYGPERVEAWGGLKPWDGYRNYKGMIPFDGFSILEKINECGICLVLSSDTHRRASSATNRLYEACAAGAVIISDDNAFVVEHFKDAALFISFNKKDPVDTFRQIMEKYEWIVKHPDEAKQLALRAQQIYINDYSLDRQLKKIIDHHPERFLQLSKDMYAQNEDKKVLVTFVLNTQKETIAKELLDTVINNLHNQLYQNIELGVAVDDSIVSTVEEYCNKHAACANVVGMSLFDKKGVRAMTDGEAVRKLQIEIPHDYYMNTTADETWYYDHVTSLVRAITDGKSAGAYSGAAFRDVQGIRRINFFDNLDTGYLFHVNKPNHPLVAGQFLFTSDVHRNLPDYVFGNLDGKEHMVYAGNVSYKEKKSLSFTKRMSLCCSAETKDARCTIVNETMQMRFVKDLVRFDVPDGTKVLQVNQTPVTNENLNKRNMTDWLLYIPIKTYIKLRFYRIMMRNAKPSSDKYKKYSAKYDACLDQYRRYWNV